MHNFKRQKWLLINSPTFFCVKVRVKRSVQALHRKLNQASKIFSSCRETVGIHFESGQLMPLRNNPSICKAMFIVASCYMPSEQFECFKLVKHCLTKRL